MTDPFQAAVDRALDSLPRDIAKVIDNLEMTIEDHYPGDPDLYGLYEGIPMTQRMGDDTLLLPDRIRIFKRPLVEDFGDDPERLNHEIRVTVLHELAHYLGIDEERLAELGWA
jgi:predicted Zn-dependent protease with MMP-like domain